MTHVSFGSQCGGEPGGASESSEAVCGLVACPKAGAAPTSTTTSVSTAQRMSGGTLLPQQDAQRPRVREQRRAQRLVVHRRGRVVEREQPTVQQPAVHLGD